MATHAVESALETSVPARRRRVLPIILATTATLALGAFAFAKWRFARVHVTTDNAQVDGHITVISPRVQAFVSQVRVDDNRRVNEGDTLVVLDDRDLRVREDQAKADLASAIAAAGSNTRGGQAQAQLAWSEAQASSAQANVASAEAAARKAAADLERMKVLAQERIVPPQQLDESEAAADAAKANLTAAQKQASAARFSLLPPDNATGNFTKVVQRVPVRISVDSGLDPEHPLRPGMSVEATIQTR